MIREQTFAEREADNLAFMAARKAAEAVERARHDASASRARAIIQAVQRQRWIAQRLAELEATISQWCMRAAWPGKFHAPPFAAWEERAALWREIGKI